MKKIKCLLIIFLITYLGAFGQTRTCGSITNLQLIQHSSPSDYQSFMNLESFIQNYISSVGNGNNAAILQRIQKFLY